MQLRRFEGSEKPVIQEAVLIAEGSATDFFKLSDSQWRRSRYDILTLEGLREEEISSSRPGAVGQIFLLPAWSGNLSCRLLTVSYLPPGPQYPQHPGETDKTGFAAPVNLRHNP